MNNQWASVYKTPDLGPDASPNAVAPAANKQFQVTYGLGQAVGLAVMPVGTAGQTATGVLWVKDDVAGVWLKWQDVTTTFGNEPFFIPAPPNAKMHLQVTAGNLSAVVIGLFPYASSQVDIGAIAVEAKLDTIHLDVDGVETKLDTLHTDMDGVEGKLDTLHADVDGVETALGTLHTDVATTLGGKLDTLHADVDGVEGKLDTLHSDVDGVETALGTLHTDVATTIHTDLATTIAGKQDTGNLALAAIGLQLPATLGAKTTAASLAVALPTDLQPFKSDTPGFQLTLIRTLAAAVADVEPPVDGSAWVTMPGSAYAPILEIPVGGYFTGVGGTVPPAMVTVQVWTRLGAGGAIRSVFKQTFPASYFTLPAALNPYMPLLIPISAPDVYVTITFPDGTAPTLTGNIYGRMVARGELTRKDFPRDPDTGLPLFQQSGYNKLTNSQQTSDDYQPCDRYLPEPLGMNEASKVVGNYNYPSDDGSIVAEHGQYAVEIDVTAPAGCTIVLTPQATMRDTWAAPKNISKAVYSTVTGANLGAAITVAPSTSYSSIWIFGGGAVAPCNYGRVRINIDIAGVASGALTFSSRKAVA